MNRLNLDFSLQYSDERQKFLDKYLKQKQFIDKPPTENELNTMSDYLLWGKNRDTGLNAKQEGIELETKHKTWDTEKIQSLDYLMECPAFNETQISALTDTPLKIKREVFSREQALAHCPEHLTQTFNQLFNKIDELDLVVTLWENEHNRRKLPPRADLVNKFSAEELEGFKEKVKEMPQKRYLGLKHQLVEARREQYTISDSYREVVGRSENYVPLTFVEEYDFEAGIEVLPLGLVGSNKIEDQIFKEEEQLIPSMFAPDLQKRISDLVWEKRKFAPNNNQLYFDFRDEKHIYQMISQLNDLREAAQKGDNLDALVKTLGYYIDFAKLNDMYKDILEMKISKKSNIDIAFEINRKYQKSYRDNYISTIFKQKIVPQIAAAAKYHQEIIENLFFKENFKTCSCCKIEKLLNPINFAKKKRSNDGFSTRCKQCEKKLRSEK